MEVILRVEEGQQKGTEFRFGEADNFFIGREDPASLAHFQLSGDTHVSRHHLLIEVRPPVCLVRDNGSLNKTYLRHQEGEDWEEIGEAIVSDGDRIMIGRTVIEVRVLEEEGMATVPQRDLHPMSAGAVLCLRCGATVEQQPELDGRTLRDKDFMCAGCQDTQAAHLAEAAKGAAASEATCGECGISIGSAAEADGRAEELSDVAIYLCPTCAERKRRMHKSVGDYKALRKLGRGSMGIVYLVWHPETHRLAALKQFNPLGDPSPDAVLRFLREITSMQDLVHPNLVRLYGVGQAEEDPYFVSEYVPDGDLSQYVLDEGELALSWRAAAGLIADSLVGLAHFHMSGDKYVHRDIKPQNILVRKENGTLIPKVADFGCARSYAKHGGTVSYEGQFGGTPTYMPPEQFTDFSGCGPPTDVYAMGVTLYHLLTGVYPLGFLPPWQRKQGVRLRRDPVRIALEDDPRPISMVNPDIPSSLAKVVDRAVDKEAGQRFQSAEEFRAAILEVLRS